VRAATPRNTYRAPGRFGRRLTFSDPLGCERREHAERIVRRRIQASAIPDRHSACERRIPARNGVVVNVRLRQGCHHRLALHRLQLAARTSIDNFVVVCFDDITCTERATCKTGGSVRRVVRQLGNPLRIKEVRARARYSLSWKDPRALWIRRAFERDVAIEWIHANMPIMPMRRSIPTGAIGSCCACGGNTRTARSGRISRDDGAATDTLYISASFVHRRVLETRKTAVPCSPPRCAIPTRAAIHWLR